MAGACWSIRREQTFNYVSTYTSININDSLVQELEVEKYLHGILCQGHGYQSALPYSRLSRSLGKTIALRITFC